MEIGKEMWQMKEGERATSQKDTPKHSRADVLSWVNPDEPPNLEATGIMHGSYKKWAWKWEDKAITLPTHR